MPEPASWSRMIWANFTAGPACASLSGGDEYKTVEAALGHRQLLVELVHVWPADIPGPAQLLEDPDQPGGDVDLALHDAVAGATWVGVGGVVPRFAEAEGRQRPE